MRRILLLLTMVALMVVVLAMSASTAFGARPENHFLDPDSGVLFDAGPGGPEDQGKAPGRVFIGGFDDTHGHEIACNQIGDEDVDTETKVEAQTPIFEGGRGCRVFLPGVDEDVAGIGGRDHPPLDFKGNNFSGTVQDVDVTIKGLTHTHPSDLVVTLEDPDGTRVELLGRAGGGDDVSNVTFTLDDEATDPLPTPLQPGTYLPAQPLSAFDGHTANGAWKLYVEDTGGSDSGKISDLSIIITT